MSKREMIARELNEVPEDDLDKLLAFLRMLREASAEDRLPLYAAESALSKDWLSPEEEEAWANL
jgi:hypothetical protein